MGTAEIWSPASAGKKRKKERRKGPDWKTSNTQKTRPLQTQMEDTVGLLSLRYHNLPPLSKRGQATERGM
ncbi:hypothetical protein EJB05_55422, partial [Eragrostis curvula]